MLEYEGTRYNGWQSQKKKARVQTIQEILEEKISRLAGPLSASVTAAGRTDAGVHALGQTATFRTFSALPAPTIKKALNAMLPDDIRVLEATDCGPDFHPRYDALGKTYFYLIGRKNSVPVFMRNFIWAVPYGLDTAKMRAAASLIAGKRDFASFRASGCSAKTSTRDLRRLEIEETGKMDFLSVGFEGEFLKITLTADAFLRHMVRNIVGTLVEVGRGRIPVEDIQAIVSALDRRKAGPAAPAHGLFLERVFYGGG